jgi:hypothetical protein
MGKFTLVLFPDEERGLRGLSALQRLHRESGVALRGAALLQRDEDGLLLLRKDAGGTLLEGSLGAVVRRAPSNLLEFLARDLAPRTFALISEGADDSMLPIDAWMERLGGRVACW